MMSNKRPLALGDNVCVCSKQIEDISAKIFRSKPGFLKNKVLDGLYTFYRVSRCEIDKNLKPFFFLVRGWDKNSTTIS